MKSIQVPTGEYPPTTSAESSRAATVAGFDKQGEQAVKKSLIDTLMGFRKSRNADPVATKKEKTLAAINESEPTTSAKPRVRRTVGLTEARLRARNQQSWMTSTQGWSDFFGRFTTSAKR